MKYLAGETNSIILSGDGFGFEIDENDNRVIYTPKDRRKSGLGYDYNKKGWIDAKILFKNDIKDDIEIYKNEGTTKEDTISWISNTEWVTDYGLKNFVQQLIEDVYETPVTIAKKRMAIGK